MTPPSEDATESHELTPRLVQEVSDLLAGTTRAISYSGFRSGQHPDRGQGAKDPTAEQMLEDLRLLAPRFGLIRLYDAKDNSEAVLRLIEEERLPIRVMLGAWLDAEVSNHEDCGWLTEPIPPKKLARNRAGNEREVVRAIELARRYPDIVVAVNVGNESLVRWNDHLVDIGAMTAYLGQVKAAIPQPVTTADNYAALVEHAGALAPVVDFVAVHTYPVWEGRGLDEGMAYTIDNLLAVRSAMPDTPIAIGEAGWPSVASEFGERASLDIQRTYVRALDDWAEAHRISTFHFEAFDEDWKGNPHDPMGAEKHWGLFDIDRRPKPVIADWYPDLPPSPGP